MADLMQPSALLKRHEQLKRWEESDTNKAVKSPPPESRKVKFQDGCIFLAACSSGDRDEVLRMLDKGADINTANVDGLTALHQACIDDNLDMVEFLVDHGADVDVCDNEGWTPLHATASCGFTEIARYLIRVNANVAAVNNDGDLPFDICEDVEMENLLRAEMEEQGVDADAARQEEENQMLADANKWLNNKSVREKRHPKTGATALHVASAKGYMKVISILMQAGIDVNAKDHDGWTPLHAAAHWGQEEACKVLAEHMCDFDIKNNAGHTAFDVADTEIIKLLEELKQKQASLKDTNSLQNEVIQLRGQQQKRRPDKPLTIIEPQDLDGSRSSVTRMSGDQKQSVTLKTKERGDPSLIHNKTPEEEPSVTKSCSSSSEAEESSESETEKQNAINNQTSEINNQARDRDKPPITTTVEIQKPDMPKIDEKGENIQVPDEKDVENEDDRKAKEEVPRIEKIGDSVDHLMEKEKGQGKEQKEKEEKSEEKQDENKETKKDEPTEEEKTVSGRGSLSRSLSAPAAQNEVPSKSVSRVINQKEDEVKLRDIPLWRAGLRKTGSTSLVTETVNSTEGDKALSRSASSPRLPVDSNQRPANTRVAFQDTTTPSTGESQDSRLNDRFGSQYGNRIGSSYRRPTSFTSSSSYTSVYTPFSQRQQDSSRLTTSLTTTTNSSLTTNAGITTTSSIASSSSITSPQSNISISRRSYEPPKRDEEAETQRKARAKRARETRRSTQGVTLEDIQKAEEVLGSSDKSKLPTTSTSATTTATTTTTTTTTEDRSRVTDLSSKDSDISKTSSYSSVDSIKKDTSENVPSSRRRNYEDKRDDDIRGSYRRSRDSQDFNTTESAYIPRRDRNALSSSDGTIASSSSSTSSLSTGSGLSRASSLRNRRLNGELVDESKESNNKDSKDKDTQEKSHDMRAVRARKTRRERRSTGIVSYDAKNDEEDEKEDDKKEEKKEAEDKSAGSRYSGRYSSTSDVGTSDKYSTTRPSSYIDHYRSTPSLDSDYKRLYEDEKAQNERLKKELERTKKDLLEAKTELDKMIRRNEAQRVTDTNEKREKRTLERRVSELEEEVKKMELIKAENRKFRDENGALIRVISKLSK